MFYFLNYLDVLGFRFEAIGFVVHGSWDGYGPWYKGKGSQLKTLFLLIFACLAANPSSVSLSCSSYSSPIHHLIAIIIWNWTVNLEGTLKVNPTQLFLFLFGWVLQDSEANLFFVIRSIYGWWTVYGCWTAHSYTPFTIVHLLRS